MVRQYNYYNIYILELIKRAGDHSHCSARPFVPSHPTIRTTTKTTYCRYAEISCETLKLKN